MQYFTLFTMVNVMQEVNTLFYYPQGRPLSMQNYRFIVHIVYLFLHGCDLYYQDYQIKRVNNELQIIKIVITIALQLLSVCTFSDTCNVWSTIIVHLYKRYSV